LSTEKGKTGNISIYVKNTGSARASNIELLSVKPENWELAFDPEKIEAIEPGDLKQVEVNITPAAEALERVGLRDDAEKKVAAFSRGMRQRLAIAEILIKEPKIAFLDEPTLGLDPEGTTLIIDYIKALSREHNITILLSSHDLKQVQRIADRIGIMIHGKLIAEGPIEKLAHEKLGVEDTEISLDDVYMKYFQEVTS